MDWYIMCFLAIIFYAVGNGLTRFYSPRIEPLPALLLQLCSAFVLTIIALLFTIGTKKVGFGSGEVKIAVFASGIVWAIAQILLFMVFSKNAPLSVVIPFIVGGIGIGGVVVGILFFKEPLTISRFIGIAIVLLGSIVLAKG